ncbi:hypothetical protein FACS189437_10550 [Bacteroidia bacterium]|nr:hypothetical protein FACS189437_10550 [Bacteroidia bacterium]
MHRSTSVVPVNRTKVLYWTLSQGSAESGLLLPNVSITNVKSFQLPTGGTSTIANAIGMVVYNTNPVLGEGLYVWNGTKWKNMADRSGSYTDEDGNLVVIREDGTKEVYTPVKSDIPGVYLDKDGESVYAGADAVNAAGLVVAIEHGGKLRNCYNSSSIHIMNGAGGLTVFSNAPKNILIENCYNIGSITVTAGSSGGFICNRVGHCIQIRQRPHS